MALILSIFSCYFFFPVKYLSVCFGHFITGLLVDVLRVLLCFRDLSLDGYVVCNYFSSLPFVYSVFYMYFHSTDFFHFVKAQSKTLFGLKFWVYSAMFFSQSFLVKFSILFLSSYLLWISICEMWGSKWDFLRGSSVMSNFSTSICWNTVCQPLNCIWPFVKKWMEHICLCVFHSLLLICLSANTKISKPLYYLATL